MSSEYERDGLAGRVIGPHTVTLNVKGRPTDKPAAAFLFKDDADLFESVFSDGPALTDGARPVLSELDAKKLELSNQLLTALVARDNKEVKKVLGAFTELTTPA